MSALLRQTVTGMPRSASAQDAEDYSSSSSSSASSTTTIDTIRPSSREQPAALTHWTNYFDQELYLPYSSSTHHATYHAFLSPPTDPSKGPLFICHHGAGSAAMSFALFARELRIRLPHAGVLALSTRGHGSVVTDQVTGEISADLSLSSLVADALAVLLLVPTAAGWSALPPSILVGHSLGGAVTTALASPAHAGAAFGEGALLGNCVIDVVEGSAVEALGHMKTYLASRPQRFDDPDSAILWHLRSRTLRLRESAEASVPALLVPEPEPSSGLVWRTALSETESYWQDWFGGMSARFLAGKAGKLLVLAGTDRLDRELMIGQMQGKFQLSVVPEAGHFVQEDAPARTAELLVEFFRRNDRSQMVLPPKVDELIAMGRKI